MDPFVNSLNELKFTNTLWKNFEHDEGPAQLSRQVKNKILAKAELQISAATNEQTLIISDDLLNELELEKPHDNQIQEWSAVFSGKKIIPGMQPMATRYGGHQFGHWAGQLGDGRATLIGEIQTSKNNRWEIQLKGAGRTPFSRNADGRAVLRSSIREYLCSEAVHHLGIPTTRALTCVLTGEQVVRDMFYNGHPEYEPGAITTRVSPSFLRFGHFQILYASEEHGLLKQLIDFTIANYFSEIDIQNPQRISLFFKSVAEKTALLMVDWARVGFVHGVMNTDNMSILGLTIDYGPYGWLDTYDPDWTPNTTDAERRRYRFGQQPAIALWNLARLADALSPFVEKSEDLEDGLQHYKNVFEQQYIDMRLKKIGLVKLEPSQRHDSEELTHKLDEWMTEVEIDPTIFYRHFNKCAEQHAEVDFFADAFYNSHDLNNSKLKEWFSLYNKIKSQQRIDPKEFTTIVNKTNPVFILRNYISQLVIDEITQGQTNLLQEVNSALQNPYELNDYTKRFFAKRPDWAKDKPGCSALSCSS